MGRGGPHPNSLTSSPLSQPDLSPQLVATLDSFYFFLPGFSLRWKTSRRGKKEKLKAGL